MAKITAYRCDYCGKVYMTERGLNWHLENRCFRARFGDPEKQGCGSCIRISECYSKYKEEIRDADERNYDRFKIGDEMDIHPFDDDPRTVWWPASEVGDCPFWFRDEAWHKKWLRIQKRLARSR